jgi:hypothetical protein
LSSCFSSSMSTAMGYKSVSFSFAVAIVRCAACGDQEMYCVGEKVFGQGKKYDWVRKFEVRKAKKGADYQKCPLRCDDGWRWLKN